MPPARLKPWPSNPRTGRIQRQRRIGVPTGDIEARLAACPFGDLHWARALYAERALELRRDGRQT